MQIAHDLDDVLYLRWGSGEVRLSLGVVQTAVLSEAVKRLVFDVFGGVT
jgi:hypothetical protein